MQGLVLIWGCGALGTGRSKQGTGESDGGDWVKARMGGLHDILGVF
jgi:hypothetical protein